MYTYIYIYMCVCVYVDISLSLYIYIYREREKRRLREPFASTCSVNIFQTTLTPDPEKLYRYYSATTQEETCVRMCSSNAFKFRYRWFGNCSFMCWLRTNGVNTNGLAARVINFVL